MKSRKVLIGIGLTLTAIMIVHYVRTKRKSEKKRTRIADEGYETAEDILYPKRRYLKLG